MCERDARGPEETTLLFSFVARRTSTNQQSATDAPLRVPSIGRLLNGRKFSRRHDVARPRSALGVVDVARHDLALADMVGAAHDAFLLHALDDAGGAVVADLQVAMDEAHAALALARHEGDRLIVELVALALLATLARQAKPTLFALGIVGDALDIGR